jgi:hypothetical protein
MHLPAQAYTSASSSHNITPASRRTTVKASERGKGIWQSSIILMSLDTQTQRHLVGEKTFFSLTPDHQIIMPPYIAVKTMPYSSWQKKPILSQTPCYPKIEGGGRRKTIVRIGDRVYVRAGRSLLKRRGPRSTTCCWETAMTLVGMLSNYSNC